MQVYEYRNMKSLEKTHWWHVGRSFILKYFLDKHFLSIDSFANLLILDVGCGTGGNAPLLNKYGEVIGIDNSNEALSLVDGKYKKLVCGEAFSLPFDASFFDCLVATDVLEHIDDDLEVAAIVECLRVLKIGGGFIVSVPAYPWLWSGHDEALNHKRRYSMGEVILKIKNGGFQIVQISHAVSFLMPLIVGYRLVQKIFGVRQKNSYVFCPRPMNLFFIALLKLESFLIRKHFNLPVGTSIFVYAIKPTYEKQN